jgi:hypothetical protein
MKQMSKYFVIMLLLLGRIQLLFAQEEMPLYLEVSHQGITVVVLEAKINEVNLGSDDYVVKVKEHYLLLKSRKPQAAPTSLFVTYDDYQQFLHATLTYAIKPPKTYDLRASLSQSLVEDPENQAKQGKEWIAPQILKRISSLASLPQQYKDIGVRKDKLTAILTHILADKDYFYLQLFMHNEGSAAFEVEEVVFCYVSGAQERQQVVPIYAPKQEGLAAYTHQAWVYVIPVYALKQKDKLEIDFWEKKGARHLQLVIPSSILLTSMYEASE